MRALVTGASGLIGSHIVKTLLRSGHEPVAMVRPTSDRSALASVESHIEFAEGDVLDPADLDRVVRGCDLVFHTAVPFAYQGQVDDDIDRTAAEGTKNVLHAARAHAVQRVVVTSSSVVFGYSLTETVLDETAQDEAPLGDTGLGGTALDGSAVGDTALGGTAPAVDRGYEPGYVQAKMRQHRQALWLGTELGVEVVMACPTITVGPESTRLGPSNAIVVQYLSDPFAMTYAGGINIVSADDVARGHLLLAEHGRPGHHYLLGGDNLSWLDVHSLVAELCGVAAPRAIAAPPVTYVAAMLEELFARARRRKPVATREQASMTGRYYWYRSSAAAALGFGHRPARDALAEAIGWLAASPHMSREMRTSITLHPDVYAARRRLATQHPPATPLLPTPEMS